LPIATVLAAYAAFSYFLGRSHDNNILNLAPWIALLLLSALAMLKGPAARTMASVLAVSFLAWLPAFGWSDRLDSWARAGFGRFGPAIVDQFAMQNPQTAAAVKRYFEEAGSPIGDTGHLANALSAARKTCEGVVVVNYGALSENAIAFPVWAATHSPANLGSLPSQRRSFYIAKVAMRLRKPGWLVIDQRVFNPGMLAEFSQCYESGPSSQFGDYFAFQLSPRPNGCKLPLAAFMSAARLSSDAAVATPGGRGAFFADGWATLEGPRAAAIVVSGFSVSLPEVQIPSNGRLFFDAGLAYPTNIRARLWVAVRAQNAQTRVWQADLTLTQASTALVPVSVDLSRFAGQKVHLVFGVETPDGSASGHWGVFADPGVSEVEAPSVRARP
jgi:hypothetical protein